MKRVIDEKRSLMGSRGEAPAVGAGRTGAPCRGERGRAAPEQPGASFLDNPDLACYSTRYQRGAIVGCKTDWHYVDIFRLISPL